MYRIAIIDDDEKALENLKEKIESYRQSTKCEFCIRTYTSGKEYLKEDPNTDILFLDIEMPEMNGIEIEVMHPNDNDEEDLMKDMISIVTSFLLQIIWIDTRP